MLKMKIDNLDKKILNELITNSKVTYRELAKKLGVTFVTIMNRIKKLEKEKIITNYTAQVNYLNLGYDIYVLIEITIAKGKLFEVEGKISKKSCVRAVYDCTGDFDVCVLARFKNSRSMDAFLKEIQSYNFVLRTNTRLILNTIREEDIKVI